MLGTVLAIRGEHDEAEPFFRRGYNGRQEVYGDEHAETLYSAERLGALLAEKARRLGMTSGDVDSPLGDDDETSPRAEAETLYRHVLDKRRKIFGPQHAHTLAVAARLKQLVRPTNRQAEDVSPRVAKNSLWIQARHHHLASYSVWLRWVEVRQGPLLSSRVRAASLANGGLKTCQLGCLVGLPCGKFLRSRQ